jgi:nicotinamidase-related amidase
MKKTDKLSRARTQLLIIDVQEKVAPLVEAPEALIWTANRLVFLARKLGIPITISEHYPKGLGPTAAPIREAVGNEGAFFGKAHFSCLEDAELRARFEQLRGDGREQILIAGIETHVCVMQTALDLAAAGFDVFVAADAVSSRTRQSRDLALARMREAGCVIADSEMAMFEWTGRAGTPEFREVQALLKQPAPPSAE